MFKKFTSSLVVLIASFLSGSCHKTAAADAAAMPILPAHLAGILTSAEPVALVEGMEIKITLEVVPLPGNPVEDLARTVIQPAAGHTPVAFQLTYDPMAIQANQRYAVRAAILSHDRVLYRSEPVGVALPRGRHARPIQIVLQPAPATEAASKPSGPTPAN